MLKIYYTLNSIFRKYYSKKSEDFQKGFTICLHLVEIGMNKHPQYNAFVENERLEKEADGLRKQIREKDRALEELRDKTNKNSIVSLAPASFFKEYKVTLEGSTEEFSIVTNMKFETWLNMCSNFAGRYNYKDIEEAKAMMLSYINSKSSLGFKAYKDEKTALKDKVKIRR